MGRQLSWGKIGATYPWLSLTHMCSVLTVLFNLEGWEQ
jgi:hypothetical protein